MALLFKKLHVYLLETVPLIIVLCIFIFGQNNLYSQCFADAGKDTVLCINVNNVDSLMIGGDPTAIGTAPFTYEWSAHETFLSYSFYASDFLSDTTIANPYLFPDPGFESVDLYLKVVDQLGVECFDTLKVRFSSAVYSIINRSAYIELGDSVQLYTSINGGIEPVTFSWSPATALSNPSIQYPYASPTVSTGYVATLIDSVGCEYEELDVFQVYVDVTNLNTEENLNFTAFFDYSLNQLKIKNPENKSYNYSIFNSLGVLVAGGETANTEIECQSFSSGMYYFIALPDNSNQEYRLKFIVN